MSQAYHVVIVGGGAAGFFAAITCAEKNPSAKVVILERGTSVLNKVKISGGGRCNLTHACFEPKDLVKFYPRGEKELLGPFYQFCSGDTVEWFESRGVKTKIESDGRMFPESNSSQSVMDCLMESAQKAGVEVKLKERVDKIHAPLESEKWKIEVGGGSIYEADQLMMASGSNPRVWNLLKDLGHKIVEPVPSLFTFNIKDQRIDGLPGLSVPSAQVKIVGNKLQASGPLLITHWGMSGPAILKLSAWGARLLNGHNYQFDILVNWVGGMARDQLLEKLNELRQKYPKQLIAGHKQLEIPLRLWKSLITAAGIPLDLRWADISKKSLNKLIEELTNGQYCVNGKSTFKEEFVTAGGVHLKEVNFKKFESKVHPGLFMAGEVLNIDAITGGFNFQAAWTGGWLAGNAMADNCFS